MISMKLSFAGCASRVLTVASHGLMLGVLRRLESNVVSVRTINTVVRRHCVFLQLCSILFVKRVVKQILNDLQRDISLCLLAA